MFKILNTYSKVFLYGGFDIIYECYISPTSNSPLGFNIIPQYDPCDIQNSYVINYIKTDSLLTFYPFGEYIIIDSERPP